MADIFAILRRGVRMVGVSAMTGEQCGAAADIFSATRALAPQAFTVLGGVHGSMVTDQCITDPDVDFVVVGEGEKTMCELLASVKDGARDFSHVKGLAWKQAGEAKLNPPREFSDLADAPFPLTTTNRRYFESAAKTGHLSYYSTRGCPFRCAFCYNLVFNRRKWRQMPDERLREDLLRLRSELSFGHIYLVDDYLGHRVERLAAVSAAISSIGLTWHSSIRMSDITTETAEILDEGNCRMLLLGIESAADSVQQGVLVKDYKGGEGDVRRCVDILRKTRISPLYSFMYGVPGETLADLEATAQLAEWIYDRDERARIGFYAYTPYPGTPLYKAALQDGFQPPQRLGDWRSMSLSNDLNPALRDLYYIAGLRFRGRRGDRTDENFPGARRLLIAPFEALARRRWQHRIFRMSNFERYAVKTLIQRASRRNRSEETRDLPLMVGGADRAKTPNAAPTVRQVSTEPKRLPIVS
jgi:anaerobic magnesium-protoporphyrin IX monomethyl ester cyclase